MRKLFRREPDPFSAARYGDIVRSVRTRRRRHMRHWWQWALLAFFLLITITAGYGAWLFYSTQGEISTDCRECEPAEGLDPFNALLVGSDSREGLTEEEQFDLGAGAVGGSRADTLILAHIDPAENRVTMVQFPRDLYVPVPGLGNQKINAALQGGHEQLVATVKQLTGLKINQYVEINIAGFRDLVDAIGGVDVCVTEPISFDPQTGIEITEDELGIVHFDGDRAIRFVRSRHFTTGDFERIQNQQKFVAAAINKITSSSTLFNPTRIPRLAKVAGENLKTTTSILGLKRLAEDLQDFDPDRYEAYVTPNLGIGAVDGQSVVLPDLPAMEVLFRAIENNESPLEAEGVAHIEPSTVRVGVYNGTGLDGAAAAAAAELEEATDIGEGPVDVTDIADAPRQDLKKTIIVYEPRAEKLANLVASAIPGAELREGKTIPFVDVAVLVGPEFETTRLVEIIPLPLPTPGRVPEICRQ